MERPEPALKGINVKYETKSDIELTLNLACANAACKTIARVRLLRGCSSVGYYHSKKYGSFDTRNEGFVCDACQAAYDKHYRKQGWDKTYGMLALNRSLA